MSGATVPLKSFLGTASISRKAHVGTMLPETASFMILRIMTCMTAALSYTPTHYNFAISDFAPKVHIPLQPPS